MTALAQALQHLPQLQTLDLMCALAMAQGFVAMFDFNFDLRSRNLSVTL